jgi:histidine triad (HIT) family protein
MSCVFCRIVKGEIPAEVVACEAGAVAFLDVHPLADGHTVVVPTAHVGLVEELEPAQVSQLFGAVARLAGAVRRAVGAAATTIGINDGPASGQTIPHVHVHIVPRWEGDGAGNVHLIFRPGARRPVKDVAAAVRKALA